MILLEKKRRTAADAWIDSCDPLNGLSIAQAKAVYNAARRNGSPLLQKIYAEIESADPVLMTCVERRQSALAGLGWRTVADASAADAVLAEEQRRALEEFADGIANLDEAIEHLDLAFFRGHSVVQPIWEGGAVRTVSLLESWNFLRDADGRLLWNPDCSYDPAACEEIPPSAMCVALLRRRAIDWPALSVYIRKHVGERDWGRFLERYGLPPVDAVMAPNATEAQRGDYVQAVEDAHDGRSTAWPSGTTVSRAEGARGQDPFSAFVEHQERQIVLMATGGTLTSLAQADTGSLAGGAQMDVWEQIVQRDGVAISGALHRGLFVPFLRRAFPGRPALARLVLGRETEPTADEAADLAGKLRAAGYRVDQSQLEEATGFKLERDETPQQPGFGGFGGFANKAAPQDPSSGVAKPLQNARKGSGATDAPEDAETRLDAILDDFAGKLADEMADGMFKAAAEAVGEEEPGTGNGKESVRNKTDANGMEHSEDDGKFTGDGAVGGDDGGHTPEQRRRIEDYAAAVDNDALAWREKVLTMDEKAQKKEYFQFGTSDSRMAGDIKAVTGINTEGWPIKMQGNHAAHIDLRHGAQGKADHSMSDPKDFARIGYAIRHYDDITPLPDNEGYRSGDNSPAKQIEFRTRIDGTMAVQTVVPDTRRKTLLVTSTRIEKAKG